MNGTSEIDLMTLRRNPAATATLLAILPVLLLSTARAATLAPRAVTPPPPGPHLVIRVPVRLRDLPSQVDTYEVRCTGNVLAGTTTSATPVTGVVSGPIPAGADFSTNVDVGLTFKLARGEDITKKEFRYQCSLFLRGTAYGTTTTYLADQDLSYPLAPGRTVLESGFPVSTKATSRRWTGVQTAPAP